MKKQDLTNGKIIIFAENYIFCACQRADMCFNYLPREDEWVNLQDCITEPQYPTPLLIDLNPEGFVWMNPDNSISFLAFPWMTLGSDAKALLLFLDFPETSRCWKTLQWRMVHLVVSADNPADDCTGLHRGVSLQESPALLLTDAMWALTSRCPSLGLYFYLVTWGIESGSFLSPFQHGQQKSPTSDLVS